MLARLRPLPERALARRAVAVIIPARNEEDVLANLLAPLAAQLRAGDELIVVDDDSTDATTEIASRFGAVVLRSPTLDTASWMGKPHACFAGANASTAPLLVFVDADVEPSEDLLDRVAAALELHPGHVVSVQPWHRTQEWYEQASLLGNIVSLMGTGAMTPIGRRVASTVAFGPVLAVDRSTYERVGGHGHPAVRRTRVEDIALARAVGAAEVYTGRPDVRFRMYAGGLRSVLDGWTRNMSSGLAATPWWAVLAVTAWVWSVAGGWLAWPWAYPLTALQLWVLGRRVGSFRWVTAAVFPVVTAIFVGVVARSLLLRVTHRSIRWKGRLLLDN